MKPRPSPVLALIACYGVVTMGLADDPLPNADLIITNARVWTGDPNQPAAEVVLVKGDRIVRVGGNELVERFKGGNVKIIDAQGRRVIPGLIDCHTHIVSGGLTLTQLQLREAIDKEDFIRRVKEWAAANRAVTVRERSSAENQAAIVKERSAWILGRGWTTESWIDSESEGAAGFSPRGPHASKNDSIEITPAKEWIDPVTSDRPAFLIRMDGHQALANSAALKLAGITKDSPDPPGGRVERHPQTGEPTGILKDDAMDLVNKLIPEPTWEQKEKALRAGMKLFNKQGITMIHDMSDFSDGDVFFAFDQLWKKSLSLRICGYCEAEAENWQTRWWAMFTEFPGTKETWWRAVGVKGYMDGSLGSKTAYMRDPYLDNDPQSPEWRGLLTPKPKGLLGTLPARRDRQVAIHAIGDQANHLLLDAYERLIKEFPNSRPRIEHAQHLLPEDIPRFAKLGVIASMQPLHKADDGRYAEKRLGYERCKTSYAFKSLLDSGAVVCFGSDWPVVSNNPMLGIEAAVTGKTLDGKIFVPEQNITVEQALKCYTVSAAYACFMEDELGMIKPGYLADIVILDQDVLTVPPDKIGETQVDVTIVGGKVMWERN